MHCAGTLLFTEAILFHWVETKRGMDLKKPGSQADGSFFGITEEFVPKENGYPGATDLLLLLLHKLQRQQVFGCSGLLPLGPSWYGRSGSGLLHQLVLELPIAMWCLAPSQLYMRHGAEV